MRLTSLAAGIFTLALAGYVGVTTEAPAKGAAQPEPRALREAPRSRSRRHNPTSKASNRIRRIRRRARDR